VLAIASGCPGSKANDATTTTTTPAGGGSDNQPAKDSELDKLMRTRMNVSYSQLVYLVFHAEGGPNFEAISEESARLSEAIDRVLKLHFPPQAKSEEARSVYRDYNEKLQRDNERFVSATAQKDIATMSSSLQKIGETCSACHHFFRIEIKETPQ
jgi:cytochrome c556